LRFSIVMSTLRIASQTHLPPSPELTGINPLLGPPNFELLTLDTPNDTNEYPSRLKNIADYEAFQPRALACSPPIVGSSTYSNESVLEHKGASSLGALAGAHGVAIFSVLQPQTPLMTLSHAFHSDSSKGGPVSLLSFQPNVSRSLLLASSRGTSVLLWDVSGHSLSPLLGRLGMDVGLGVDHSSIVSLSWRTSYSSSGNSPILAATTAFSACLWDIREHSNAATFRPSLRSHDCSDASIAGSA
jgi:hypothetical protein